MKISTTGAALALLSVCTLSAQVHAKPGKTISLNGAAAQYYSYRKARVATAEKYAGQQVQYYLSKNGRIYYRDPQTHEAIYVTAPRQIQVPETEAMPYAQIQGFNGQTTGNSLEYYFNGPGSLSLVATNATNISQVDREYIIKDAQGSISDDANAELAASRAQSNALHRYGVRLIADHARLNQILMTLARQKGVPVPVTLTDSQSTDIKELSGQSGRDFDKAIIAQFVKTNGDDVRDGRKELSVTRDPQVRRAVTQFVRTEEKHLREARALQNQIGK